MINYSYTARNKDGELIKGQVEADSVSAAAKTLTSKGFYPVTIKSDIKEPFSFLSRIKLKDKAFFARQLATTINVGLPIAQALRIISEEITNKSLRAVVVQVLRDVEGGTQLSVSFGRFPKLFSRSDVALISAGETSGNLDKVLARLADSIEKESSISRKVMSAMAYPAFILVIVIILVLIMTMYVMPQMEEVYSSFGSRLPTLTNMLINFSHFITRSWLYILVLTGAFVVALRQFAKTKNGSYFWDRVKISSPVVGPFMRKYYSGKFSRTMSSLVGSGVSILDSLSITADAIGNSVYREVLVTAIEKVKDGVPLSQEIKKAPEFPTIVSQMLVVGEQTGEIDSMLDNLANYFDEEVDVFIKGMMSLIEPFMIVFMGGIVAIVLIAIMLPIYSIGKII